jgi:hypothetical protein
MSSHGLHNLSVQLTLLTDIPEGRQATNEHKKWAQKNTELVTTNSEIRTCH